MTSSYTSRLGTSPEEAIKAPVVVETTANITLSGAQTINTVEVIAGNRVLVKNQTVSTENGIYVVSDSAWSRSKDWNDAKDVVNGSLVLSTYSGEIWQASFAGVFIPGETEVTFNATITNALQTVATLAELVSSGYVDGDTIYVKGRTSTGDGYQGNFAITDTDYSAEVNADTESGVYVLLDSGLYAVREDVDTLDPKWFNPNGNGTDSDSDAFQAMAVLADYTGIDIHITLPSVAWLITETVEFYRDLASKKKAEYSVTADTNAIIRHSVVPAFDFNPDAVAILEQPILTDLNMQVVGKVGYANGAIRLRRCRNVAAQRCYLRPTDEFDSGYLFELDGSYLARFESCFTFGANLYLFDTEVVATTGQQDTTTFENCGNSGIGMGFVRNSTSGRHSYLFNTPKHINDFDPQKELTETTVSTAAAGDTSITVADATNFTAEYAFWCGEGAEAEICVVDESYFSGTTIPLAFPLRFDKANNTQVIWGGAGVHLDNCRNVTINNPHYELGMAGVICDDNVEGLVINEFHCTSKSVAMSRGTANERWEIGSGYGASSDLTVVYKVYVTQQSIDAAQPPRLIKSFGSNWILPTSFSNGVRLVGSNFIGYGYIDDTVDQPAVTYATGTASIGTGVTLAVSYLNEPVEEDDILVFSGGGLFTVTSDYDQGATSITGNLAVANIAANEIASNAPNTASLVRGDLRTYRSADIADNTNGVARSFLNVLIDLKSVFSARIDGTVKGRRFYSRSSKEDSGGAVSIPNSTPTELIPASAFTKGDVMLVTVFFNDSPTFQIYGSCIVVRGNSSSEHKVDIIGTPIALTFSTVSGNLTVTQTSGGTRSVKYSVINYGAGY